MKITYLKFHSNFPGAIELISAKVIWLLSTCSSYVFFALTHRYSLDCIYDSETSLIIMVAVVGGQRSMSALAGLEVTDCLYIKGTYSAQNGRVS